MPDWTLNTKALNGASTGRWTPSASGRAVGAGARATRTASSAPTPEAEAAEGEGGADGRRGAAADPVGGGPGGGGRREVDEDVEQRADAEVGDGGGEEHGRGDPGEKQVLVVPARGRRRPGGAPA